MDTNTPFGADVPLSISSALLRRLEYTARPCVRMAIEGASTSAGAPPHWLEKASDIRTLGFSERNGQTILHMKAPRLGDAVPEVFDQQNLWPGMASPEDTAIQLIGKIGYAVRRQEASSDLYDQHLLQQFAHWKGLFKSEVRELRLPASATGVLVPVALDLTVVENARLLSDQTPAPRQVRVVGKLDMVRHSTRSFGLLLAGGEEVNGVLQEGDPEVLLRYFAEEITVFGKAVYRPSGSLLRIDTHEIVDTTEGKTAFSSVPAALRKIAKPERKVQSSKNGVEGFFGAWPGNETDEELLAALGELRR